MLRFAPALFICALASPLQAETLTDVQVLALSSQLYFEGVARSDALLVLAAARLRKPIGFRVADRVSAQTLAGVHQPLGWHEMLAEALVLSDNDAVMDGLIADLDAEGTKGMASGPFYNIASLSVGATESYPAAEFRGGELAEAYVEAGADIDLNIAVYDAAGNVVCEDHDPSPIAYCAWRPAETGPYVLKVENLGPDSATYALMTN
jgi:hypothetical protein